jgi:hypothetical protein
MEAMQISARAPGTVPPSKPPRQQRASRRQTPSTAPLPSVDKPPAEQLLPRQVEQTQPMEPVCAALSDFQVDEAEHALKQITRALDIINELHGDLVHYCKKEAEAARLAFLSDAIDKYVSDVKAILTAAQEDRRKADDVRIASHRPSTVDPVLAIWEEVIKLENEVERWPESDEDSPIFEDLQKRCLDAGTDLVFATPTTAQGVAAQLKYLAMLDSHENHDRADPRYIEIVRHAVRHLTGDPTWTIEQESAVG